MSPSDDRYSVCEIDKGDGSEGQDESVNWNLEILLNPRKIQTEN
jgi:hypothetical protein